MALWIPRLEWNDQSVTGDITNLSPTIINIASTATINVGMIASGTGIPTGAEVISKTATSVTLNVDATSSTSSATVNFFERYDFEFPPVKDSDDIYKPKNVQATSLSGIVQVQTNYIDIIRDLEFWFVNQDDADKLRDNFYLFAVYGEEFRYYPDKDEAPVYTVALDKFDFKRNRQVKKHPNFKYSLNFSFTRVL